MCSRMVVPSESECSSTLSQIWWTSQSPWPPLASAAGGWRPADAGSAITPPSRISQMISPASLQISIDPCVRACLTVLAAISLTAITKSTMRSSARPARLACVSARTRTSDRLVV